MKTIHLNAFLPSTTSLCVYHLPCMLCQRSFFGMALDAHHLRKALGKFLNYIQIDSLKLKQHPNA